MNIVIRVISLSLSHFPKRVLLASLFPRPDENRGGEPGINLHVISHDVFELTTEMSLMWRRWKSRKVDQKFVTTTPFLMCSCFEAFFLPHTRAWEQSQCYKPLLYCNHILKRACLRICQVPLVIYILLRYTVNFCLPAKRPHCRVVLPVRHIWVVLRSETI